MRFNRLFKSIAVISALMVIVIFALTCCTIKNRDAETTVVFEPTVVSEHGEVSENSKKDESNNKSDNTDIKSTKPISSFLKSIRMIIIRLTQLLLK